MAEIYLAVRSYTLSESTWTPVVAPIACNWFYARATGATPRGFIITTDESNANAMDVVDPNWAEQLPMWNKPGSRWNLSDYMMSLKAQLGNSGMQVGIMFVL